MKIVPRAKEKKGTWRMTNGQVISGTAFQKDGKIYIDQGDNNIVLIDDSDHVIYPLQYTSSFDGSLENFINTLNAMTGGIGNRFSPTQNIRAVYDLFDSNLSTQDKINSIVYGNNGVVSNKFAEEHPIWSTIINSGVDTLPYGAATLKLYKANKHGFGKNSKDSKFISSLDWTPKSWFGTRRNLNYDSEDVESLTKHVPEYLEIEKEAKANGTWLKMPDGSTWKGDPRSWVLLQSKDALKLSKNVWWHGDDITFTKSGIDVTPIENGTRILWANSNPTVARSYTVDDAKLIPLVLENGKSPLKLVDANGSLWRYAYEKNGTKYDTNTFSKDFLKDGEYLRINNVIDPGSSIFVLKSKFYNPPLSNESAVDYTRRVFLGDDIIIGKNTPRKSILGNNGNFNLHNPNIYKSLLPLTVTTYVSRYNNE